MSLTDTAVRNAKPMDKPFKIADSRGLYVLISPTTIHAPNHLRPFSSSGVINRRGDFGVEATQLVQ